MVRPKSEMDRHQATMRDLMRSRDRRETKRSISKLSVEEVYAELSFNGCSCVGPEATLRERLLRAALRGKEPENTRIPWHPWDDAEDVAPQEADPEVDAREQIERERATARDSSRTERVGRAATTSMSDDNEPQGNGIAHSERAQIHAPPTSTITVSAPITTVASSATTTATMVTPSCGTRPTAGVTRTLFAMQHMPHLVLSPEVRAQVNEQARWEYYSERYVRGVGGVRGGLTLPRREPIIEQPRVVQQPIPQAPRRGTQQQWYTPAQDFDAILPVEETPEDESSERSSEVDGEDDSEVIEELERQGRQWRADERARASEGERRARELADAAAKRAELARKKSARKSPEGVRVNRTPRVDVRADRERIVGKQSENVESD